MIFTATVSSRGQITIPAAVRSAMGIKTGAQVDFIEVEPGRFEIVFASLPVTALKGIVPKPERPVSIEDMDVADGRSKAPLD